MNNFTPESYAAFEEAALEKYDFKSSGCPDGFRSKGSQTISGKRREVCCTPDGKVHVRLLTVFHYESLTTTLTKQLGKHSKKQAAEKYDFSTCQRPKTCMTKLGIPL